MLPLDTSRPACRRRSSPIRTRAAARRSNSCTGTARSIRATASKLQYVNPATGGYPMPTIAAFLQLLPKGFSGEPYRSTDSTIYYVVEGHGVSRIGDETFSWGPRDIFVVPSWQKVSHEASDEAVLFSSPIAPRRRRSASGAKNHAIPA